MSEFWNMGGYAAFVWSSYMLVALALVGLAISSRRRQRRLTEQAEQLRKQVRGSDGGTGEMTENKQDEHS